MMGRYRGKNWNQARMNVLTVGLVFAIGLGGYAVNTGVDKGEATSIAAGYADELRQDKVRLCQDPHNRVKKECADPVPPKVQDVVEEPLPSPLPTVQGKVGPVGPAGPGPTYSQVLAVVMDVLPGIAKKLCADNGCAKDGRDGKDGDPGPPPTPEQIAAAVAAAIDEALEKNCGGSCKAEPAEPGKDGRGIASLDCSHTPTLPREQFVVTYTDGTTQTVVCKQNPDLVAP